MNVLIIGSDGYLGWTLSMWLADRGHKVFGIDNCLRRKLVEETGSWSAIPILPMFERVDLYKELSGNELVFENMDLLTEDCDCIIEKLIEWKPDTIVHLGEIPSAPYSMIGRRECNFTMINNVVGTLNLLYYIKTVVPNVHLLKLGTMGNYGTPNIDIPEGFFDVEFRGRKDRLPFPKQAGSWYHQTKVHDSNNIMFANKIWKIKSTDVMQGPVHGIETPQMIDEGLRTRFDFDAIWGTAINRFCAQAVVGKKMTAYGAGGQTRGYIALRDSMQCLTLAIENPPKDGEYRVFNQFDKTYSIHQLADIVSEIGKEFGLNPEVEHIKNPRLEKEEHYYNPDFNNLPSLGYKSSITLEDELRNTFKVLLKYKDRIKAKEHTMYPKVEWVK